METATQTLHRLTSLTWDWYEPAGTNEDLLWTVPVDDPRVVRDLEVNDVARLPWFYKGYVQEPAANAAPQGPEFLRGPYGINPQHDPIVKIKRQVNRMIPL